MAAVVLAAGCGSSAKPAASAPAATPSGPSTPSLFTAAQVCDAGNSSAATAAGGPVGTGKPVEVARYIHACVWTGTDGRHAVAAILLDHNRDQGAVDEDSVISKATGRTWSAGHGESTVVGATEHFVDVYVEDAVNSGTAEPMVPLNDLRDAVDTFATRVENGRPASG